MTKFKLSQVPKDALKIGGKVRTDWDKQYSGGWVDGMLSDTFDGGNGLILTNVMSKNGTPYFDWKVPINRPQLDNFYVDFLDDADKKEKEKKECKVEFDSVIMPDEKREQIKAAISQMDNNKLIFDTWGFGKIFEKGTAVSMLFYGVPGTGKTLMAQAIADKLGQKLLIVGPAEIETSTPGGAERNIKRHFKIAMAKARPQTGETDKDGNPIEGKEEKHVLLFDECDSLITNRDNVGVIMRGQINTLLSELETYNGIVIFTTNSIHQLDPAMERRITAKVEFEFPDQDMRKKIWKRMIPKECPIDKDVDFDKLAEFPFAGGNIKNIVLNAARHAAYTGLKKLNWDSFMSAMEREAVGLKAFEATHTATQGRPHTVLKSFARDIEGGIKIEKVTDIATGDIGISDGSNLEPEAQKEVEEERRKDERTNSKGSKRSSSPKQAF